MCDCALPWSGAALPGSPSPTLLCRGERPCPLLPLPRVAGVRLHLVKGLCKWTRPHLGWAEPAPVSRVGDTHLSPLSRPGQRAAPRSPRGGEGRDLLTGTSRPVVMEVSRCPGLAADARPLTVTTSGPRRDAPAPATPAGVCPGEPTGQPGGLLGPRTLAALSESPDSGLPVCTPQGSVPLRAAPDRRWVCCPWGAVPRPGRLRTGGVRP